MKPFVLQAAQETLTNMLKGGLFPMVMAVGLMLALLSEGDSVFFGLLLIGGVVLIYLGLVFWKVLSLKRSSRKAPPVLRGSEDSVV